MRFPASHSLHHGVRRRVLVAHPWMGRGGSEATAMWTLQALQDRAEVTFTTASAFPLARLNQLYGTSVSAAKIQFHPTRGLPGLSSGTRLNHWQRALFERSCRRISSRFDLCLSAYNPIDFGRPGIQLIGDLSFSEFSRRLVYPNADDRFCHRQSLLRRVYLSAGNRLRGGKAPPLAERGDCAVANSSWNATQLERLFGLRSTPVLYPPSFLPEVSPEDDETETRDPLSLVCLGRVAPEKEIERVISIVDRVRAKGQPVTLDLVGKAGPGSYGRRIRRMVASRREWIHTPGYLTPSEKADLMASRTFALHGCRVESFGIAVAEMAAGGLIPIVPSQGATREIALRPELIYENEAEAADRILDLIGDRDRQREIRTQLMEHTRSFRPDAFTRGLIAIIEQFLGDSLGAPVSSTSPTASHVEETLPATH